MAELEELSTGRRLPLGFRQVLGRGPTADLRLLTPGVSSLHASLAWDGLQWRLRDLGSRNGTALNGEVCRAGEDRSLSAGATFALGSPACVLRLLDDSPPRPQARRLGTEERALWKGGLIELPGEDAELPAALLWSDPQGRWVAEVDGEARPLRPGETLLVDGVAWLLDLPDPDALTAEVALSPQPTPPASLCFRVSPDGEHIELDLLLGERRVRLGHRSYHELLLVLARRRLEEAATPHFGAANLGWLYQEELEKMLRCDGRKLNMDVFRSRKQLAGEGLGAELIERRPHTRQLRLGIADLCIEPL
jgi:hypothetical protein